MGLLALFGSEGFWAEKQTTAWGARGPLPRGSNRSISPQGTYRAQKSDAQIIQECENYLNRVQTLKARFSQNSSQGSRCGMLYIKRPGKMRLVYDPKGSYDVVTNGYWLTQYNSRTKDLNNVPLESTPLYFLLQPRISFRDFVTVQLPIVRQGNVSHVRFVSRNNPDDGAVVLSFSENPFRLVRWTIYDSDQKAVTVSLSSTQENVPLSDSEFAFSDPRARDR